jgi:hypothetical protein
MQIKLYAPHHPTPAHLEQVKADMNLLHAPRIKAYYCPLRDVWLAAEGSHRIAAAVELGYTIVIQKVDLGDEISEGRRIHEVFDKWRWTGHGARYDVNVEFL